MVPARGLRPRHGSGLPRRGRARHPVHLPGGRDRYTLVVTGTILPPYRGDARVVVEGNPALSYDAYGSDPIVDLGECSQHCPTWAIDVKRQATINQRAAIARRERGCQCSAAEW